MNLQNKTIDLFCMKVFNEWQCIKIIDDAYSINDILEALDYLFENKIQVLFSNGMLCTNRKDEKSGQYHGDQSSEYIALYNALTSDPNTPRRTFAKLVELMGKKFPISTVEYEQEMYDKGNKIMNDAIKQLDKDNWSNRSGMICKTCAFFVLKKSNAMQKEDHLIGRCRKHAPTMNGFPVVFSSDWCGDHKLHEDKI